ncbi:MAG: hypothetical protein LBB36_06845, partial [Fibromonadaceae bacterium]|nr:hypothetical protein [Fibromonadaceae bacterium]
MSKIKFRWIGDAYGKIKNEKSLKLALAKRIKSADINAVKKDVMPFLKNPQSTEIWWEKPLPSRYFVR